MRRDARRHCARGSSAGDSPVGRVGPGQVLPLALRQYRLRHRRGIARCDILEHSWPAPPKPDDCIDGDYGNGVDVVGGHPGQYVCAGDTVFSPSTPVLGYGEKITKNRFTCTSKTSGMRCANRNSGHGFFLSRQTVRLF